MRITVRLQSDLQRFAAAGLEVDIADGATVADVVRALGLRPGQVWLATLEGRLVENDHRLKPGDELSLIPPVGGGE